MHINQYYLTKIVSVFGYNFLLLIDPYASPAPKPAFAGDMLLTDRQKEAIEKGEDVGPDTGSDTFAASNKATHRWPNAVIPYNIDCSLGSCIFTACLQSI